MLIVAGLAAARCLAQTTRPAGEGAAGRTKPMGLKTEKTGGEGQPAGTGGEGAPKAPAGPTTRGGQGTSGGEDEGRGGGFGGMWFYVVLLGGFVLLYVWMGRGRRRQEAKRKEMLAALKKNDKIVTIGGIMGTVIETRADEITVKVDETNNVRMKFARWAVRGVGEEARGSEQKK
jgi:preprotein translocase subunit YajC